MELFGACKQISFLQRCMLKQLALTLQIFGYQNLVCKYNLNWKKKFQKKAYLFGFILIIKSLYVSKTLITNLKKNLSFWAVNADYKK